MLKEVPLRTGQTTPSEPQLSEPQF
jgi:hypothetical protein